MEAELDKLRRVNTELQAWVHDLLSENETLRRRLADEDAAPSPPDRLSAAACGDPRRYS